MENKYKIFVIRANCYFNNVFANLFSLLLIFLASFQMSPAQSSQTAAFPLKYSANKKYLVDQNNVPFIIKEHSAWGAIQALTESAAADFMDSVKAKGFNTLMVSVLSNDQRFAGDPPKWNGNYPFTVLWDFSTPNPVYLIMWHSGIGTHQKTNY